MLGRSTVTAADFSGMRTSASALDKQADSIDRNADTLSSTFTGAPWSGKGKDAATHKGEEEKREHRKVSADFRALSTTLTTSANSMDSSCKTLVRDAEGLERDMYQVSDDWTVKDLYNYPLGFSIADANDDKEARRKLERLQRERAHEAASETRRLKGLAGELTKADQDTANAINSHLQNIAKLAPASADLSKTRAEQDMAALSGKNRDGSAASDQQKRDAAERLHAAADLDNGTREFLKSSGATGISQEKFDYLKTVVNHFPGKVDGYDSVGRELSPEIRESVRGDLADSLRILGNPHISTLQGDRGGMGQLPPDFISLLKDSPASTKLNTFHGNLSKFAEVPRLNDFKAATNLLASGDQGLRLGSDVDRGLLKQASEIAAQVTPSSGVADYAWIDGNTPTVNSAEVNRTIDAMLNNASGDHRAVHDFLTGDGMAATTRNGEYSPAQHIQGLFEHKWSADEMGARNAFDWLKDPRSVTSSGLEGELAGRSASAIAHYMSSNSGHLNSIPIADGLSAVFGADGVTTLGKLNPELLRSLASDISPYYGGLAGFPPEVLTNHHVESFDQHVQLQNLFSVFSGDTESANITHDAANDWIRFASHEAGADPRIDTSLGKAAGGILESLRGGLGDQLNALEQNNAYVQQVKAGIDGAVFDTSATAAGMIPGAGQAIGVLAPGVKWLLQGDVPPPGTEGHDKALTSLLRSFVDSGATSKPVALSWAEGYLRTHPEAHDRFAEVMAPDGTLNWNAAQRLSDDDFGELIEKIPDYQAFLNNFQSGLTTDEDFPNRPR
jgi:hypothetical protein